MSHFYQFARQATRLIGTVFWGLRAFGTEHVPMKGGALIVANHQSFVDPAIVASRLSRELCFLARSGLWSNKIFGTIISNLNAFPIRQGEGDVGAVRETIRRLQEGRALIVFPEGSRTEDGELAPVAGGIALIVRRAGVPVIPCVIEGAYDVWSRHQKLPGTGEIDMMFDAPMNLSELKGPEITRTIDNKFQELMKILRARRAQEGRTNRRYH